MPAFFERLQESIRYSRRPPEYLSTHPVTASRIADTRSRAEQYPYKQHEDSLAYHLVRAKLTVAAEADARAAVKYFEDRLSNRLFRNETAERYGLAIALARAKNYDEARTALSALAEQDPDNLFFQSALARVATATGDTARALGIYKDALALFPDDRAMTTGYADALLRAGRPGRRAAVAGGVFQTQLAGRGPVSNARARLRTERPKGRVVASPVGGGVSFGATGCRHSSLGAGTAHPGH